MWMFSLTGNKQSNDRGVSGGPLGCSRPEITRTGAKRGVMDLAVVGVGVCVSFTGHL